jgi:SAM-dependent methyltransferase
LVSVFNNLAAKIVERRLSLMENYWLKLWRELVLAGPPTSKSELAKRYKVHTRKKNERPDQLLDFILEEIDNEITVLDVGAGSGRWTIPLAKRAKAVTAVEPSSAMVDNLHENIASAKLSNIQIIQASWENAIAEPHDITVCAHAMYASPDLASFVRKIEQYTTRTCYLAMRLPPFDGIIGELSLAIYRRHHDSPNAIIAYNALYSIGIYANILAENDIYRWTDKTFEEAFTRAKRHLRLQSSNIYDTLIRDTLAKRLSLSNNCYVWPDGMRSALLWWSPSPISS